MNPKTTSIKLMSKTWQKVKSKLNKNYLTAKIRRPIPRKILPQNNNSLTIKMKINSMDRTRNLKSTKLRQALNWTSKNSPSTTINRLKNNKKRKNLKQRKLKCQIKSKNISRPLQKIKFLTFSAISLKSLKLILKWICLMFKKKRKIIKLKLELW